MIVYGLWYNISILHYYFFSQDRLKGISSREDGFPSCTHEVLRSFSLPLEMVLIKFFRMFHFCSGSVIIKIIFPVITSLIFRFIISHSSVRSFAVEIMWFRLSSSYPKFIHIGMSSSLVIRYTLKHPYLNSAWER